MTEQTQENHTHRLVRAKGGFLIHLLPSGSRQSLCGHHPENHRAHHFRRAGWTSVESAPFVRPCKKCKTALRKQLKDQGANETEIQAFVGQYYK